MEDERTHRRSSSGITLLIGLIIGLAVGYIVGIKGYIHAENESETSQEIVSETVTNATESADDASSTEKESVSVVAKTTKRKATSKSAISQEDGKFNLYEKRAYTTNHCSSRTGSYCANHRYRY